MKGKYIQAFIFLILLVLTFISQSRVAFSVVPGWHTTVYPPNYLVEITIIILSLVIAICGYIFLSFKRLPIRPKIFGLHFLLTIPIIIALLYPFKDVDMTSLSKDEIETMLSKRQWMEYILVSIFVVGQLIFWAFFTKQFKRKPSKQ